MLDDLDQLRANSKKRSEERSSNKSASAAPKAVAPDASHTATDIGHLADAATAVDDALARFEDVLEKFNLQLPRTNDQASKFLENQRDAVLERMVSDARQQMEEMMGGYDRRFKMQSMRSELLELLAIVGSVEFMELTEGKGNQNELFALSKEISDRLIPRE